MPAYARPPIVEAVIDFRLAEPIDNAQIKKAEQRTKQHYPFAEADFHTNFHIDLEAGRIEQQNIPLGVRLSSADRTDICIYRSQNFLSSRLAPYPGWETFRARVSRDWDIFSKAVGRPSLNRIGVRFINRLDVPIPADGRVQVEEFLKVWPHLPDMGDSRRIDNYVMQLVRPLEERCSLIINTAPAAASPIPNCASFVLDLDVSREAQLPRRTAELWVLLERVREMKNRVFEALITDKARELFSK